MKKQNTFAGVALAGIVAAAMIGLAAPAQADASAASVVDGQQYSVQWFSPIWE